MGAASSISIRIPFVMSSGKIPVPIPFWGAKAIG